MNNFFFFTSLLLILNCPSFGQSGISKQLVSELDSIIKKESIEKEIPAFSIILVDNNNIIHQANYGNHTINGSGIPVNSNTIYRTGSVGKTITDLAILISVDNNKVDLDQDIQKYLPEFKPSNPFKTPVTLRHLIKHQSGLVREPPKGNYFDDSSPSLETTVNSLNNTTLLWEPGSKTKYSNAGLAVVGRVLEKVYNKDYGSLIDSLIFTPLFMKNSRVGFDTSISKELARGYMWFPGEKLQVAPLFDLGMKPAGDLYISMNDMASLIIGFLNPEKRLISDELFDQMWKPSLTSKNWQMDVGLGFSLLGNFDGEYQLARHGGAVYGYATELAIIPKENLGVYAVSTKDMSGEAKSIVDWLLKAVLAERHGSKLPEYKLNEMPFTNLPATLAEYSKDESNDELIKYTGTYGPVHNPFKVYQHQGKLYALIEWFFLYPLTKNVDDTYSFPTWSLYNYEKIKFLFKNEIEASEVVIGNGTDGVHFKRIDK